MGLDEVLERATISFPRELDRTESEKLLEYLAEKLPADIHYHIAQHRNIFHNGPVGMIGVSRQEGTVEINVSIHCLKGIESIDEASYILSAFRFSLIPGYDSLDEYRAVPLWDKARNVIKDYFKAN